MLRSTSVRRQILSNLTTFRKGQHFTTTDVYPDSVLGGIYSKNASNRLSELVEEGIVDRIEPGHFQVTASVKERKSLL